MDPFTYWHLWYSWQQRNILTLFPFPEILFLTSDLRPLFMSSFHSVWLFQSPPPHTHTINAIPLESQPFYSEPTLHSLGETKSKEEPHWYINITFVMNLFPRFCKIQEDNKFLNTLWSNKLTIFRYISILFPSFFVRLRAVWCPSAL